MRKSTIIVIVCMVIAGLALAYGIYSVNLAAHPDSAPIPEQTTPAGEEESPAASGETESDDPAKGEGKGNSAASSETESDDSAKEDEEGNLNEVPVTKDPATDPLPNSNSGSDSGSNSDKPFGGGIPGFSADEIIRNPIDSGGEQPTLGESTLPEGVDPNGHTGSF